MGFPNTPILDSFTRANEGPPMTGWTDIFTGTKVVSSACQGATGTLAVNASYFGTTDYGANCEVYGTISGKLLVTNDFIGFLLKTNTSTLNGYYVAYSENTTGTDKVGIYRLDGGSGVTITEYNQEVSAGDSIGVSVIGSSFIVWYKASGGSWTSLGTSIDSTYSVAGKIGILTKFTATSGVIDDFGGGTIFLNRKTLSSIGTRTGTRQVRCQ